MEPTLDLLTIALLPGLGPRSLRALRVRGPLSAVLSRPLEHADLLSREAQSRLRSGRARRAAEDELRKAAQSGVRIVGLGEELYPGLLREIYDPPPVLYVRGGLLADEGAAGVAIVGSRAASPSGLVFARSLAAGLAARGVTIVSGLARGIDSEAHRGALDAGGRTVAVLGSGLDVIYPPENADLARRIAETGALVSEFPLGTRPYPGNFPVRNRILAGWGRGVVVVEAALRSGALVTARLALDEGREVMAVPGHPNQAGAIGTNALLRDGARLVRHAEDVLLELGFPVSPLPSAREEAATDASLLDALRKDAPQTLEALASRTGRGVPELLAELTELELEARVRRLPGSLYVRS